MRPDTQAACEIARAAVERAAALIGTEPLELLPPDLLRFYVDLREQGEALRDAVTAFAKLERALSYDKIPASFDAAGIQSVDVVGYGKIGLVRQWSCSMLDKEKGFDYLRSTGQGAMIIETVPAPTLGAWARTETEESGREPPADIFKTTIARHVSLRKS